jgi:multidrug efflux pump subunit AcrB
MLKNSWKISRVDQKSAIILQIIKQSDANAVAVSEELKVLRHETDYKSELKLEIAKDSTVYTLESCRLSITRFINCSNISTCNAQYT